VDRLFRQDKILVRRNIWAKRFEITALSVERTLRGFRKEPNRVGLDKFELYMRDRTGSQINRVL